MNFSHLPDEPLRKQKIPAVFWIILLVILGGDIRVYGVGEYYYNADELMVLNVALAPDWTSLFRFSLYETHPPLFYILLHGWLHFLHAVWFTRALSLVFGLALIPLYFLIGRKLAGEFAGILSALLVTFSCGLITQSYILRHYTAFLFFLSLGFYYYLCWKEGRDNKNLALYFIFCALACLTHFSGIFAVFLIAALETPNVLTKKLPIKTCVAWGAVNVTIAALWLFFYHIFNLSSYTSSATPPDFSLHAVWARFLTYNFYVLDYVDGYVPACILLPLGVFTCRLRDENENKKKSYLFALCALMLFAFLTVTGLYWPTGRHNTWLIPFIIPCYAIILSDAFSALEKDLPMKSGWQNPAILLFIIIGFYTYNPQNRFAEAEEFMLTDKAYRQFTEAAGKLDGHSLIIAERDDAFFFGNPYPYFDTHSSDMHLIDLPYGRTHVLFTDTYRRLQNGRVFGDFAQEAYRKYINENIDTIVFFKSRWTGGGKSLQIPISQILLCDKLKKKVMVLPEQKNPVILDKDNIFKYDITLLNMSKQDFRDHILAPPEDKQSCLH